MKEIKNSFTVEFTKKELVMMEQGLFCSCNNIRESINCYEAEGGYEDRILELKELFKENDRLRKEICKMTGIYFIKIRL